MAAILKFGDLEARPAKITGDMFLALLDMQELDELRFAELIDGVLVDMTPAANNRHGRAHSQIVFALMSRMPAGFVTFIDPRLRLDEFSLVGPDIAVLRDGDLPEESPPDRFLLCIEIADTTLGHDLRRKAELCGAGGVPDYWVVDINHRKLHVHRDPGPEGYRSVVEQDWNAPASPLFAPEIVLDLSEILRDV